MEELRPTLMPIKDYELGFNEGKKIARKEILDDLERRIKEMESDPTFLDSFENHWIYVGFKRSLSIIRES